MKYILSVVLVVVLVFPALAQEEHKGGCNKRCRDEETAIPVTVPTETQEKRGNSRREDKNEDEYVPPNNSGPDSQHGSGTR